MNFEEDITVLGAIIRDPDKVEVLVVFRHDEQIYESRIIPVIRQVGSLDVEIPLIELDVWLTAFQRLEKNVYVAGADDGAVFNVSAAGIEVKRPFEDAITRLVPAPGGKLLACTLDGRIAWIDGTRAEEIYFDADANFLNVAISSNGRIAASGEQGKLVYRRNHDWEVVDLETNLRLAGLAFVGERLFVGGDKGVCWVVEEDLSASPIHGITANIYGFTKYNGMILCAASANGVMHIVGNEASPFAPTPQSYGIVSRHGLLVAYGAQTVAVYDGAEWQSVGIIYT